MMVKKIMTAVVTALLLFISSSCFAKAYWSDLKIDEVYYEQSIEEIIAKYGKPEDVSPKNEDGHEYLWYTFRVQGSVIVVQVEDGVVNMATIFGNSKFLTSEGIGVGATKEDVIKIYGKPDQKCNEILFGQNMSMISYWTPRIEIDDPQSPYESMFGVLAFHITKDNKVYSILFMRHYVKADN